MDKLTCWGLSLVHDQHWILRTIDDPENIKQPGHSQLIAESTSSPFHMIIDVFDLGVSWCEL